jgi:hypothetical protein
MLVKAAAIAAQEGLGNGYRLVINDGKAGWTQVRRGSRLSTICIST